MRNRAVAIVALLLACALLVHVGLPHCGAPPTAATERSSERSASAWSTADASVLTGDAPGASHVEDNDTLALAVRSVGSTQRPIAQVDADDVVTFWPSAGPNPAPIVCDRLRPADRRAPPEALQVFRC